MAFRDDADAARARADALQRDLDLTRRELAESDEESDELRDKLAKAEKEAKKYRKLANKLERKAEGKPPVALIVGVAAGVVLLGAVIAVVVSTKGKATRGAKKLKKRSSKRASRGRKPTRRELERRYIAATFKHGALRWCLDHPDQRAHLAWSIYRDLKPDQLSFYQRRTWPTYFHGNVLRCAKLLGGIEPLKPLLPGVDELLAGYRNALSELAALIAKNHRYYHSSKYDRDKFEWARKTLDDTKARLRSFAAVSLTLRKAYAPHHEAWVRSDNEHAAKMKTPGATVAAPAWHAMTALFDAMVMPETTREQLHSHYSRFERLRKKLEKFDSKSTHVLRLETQLDQLSSAFDDYTLIKNSDNVDVTKLGRSRVNLLHRYQMAWGAYFTAYLIPEGWYRPLKDGYKP